MGKKCKLWQILLSWGSKITVDSDCNHEIKRHWILGSNTMTNLDSVLKSKDITANKCPYSQSYGFSSNHVWMWELDHKQGWAPKNWCFRTMVLEKTLESPLNSKEIKPVNSKRNEPWILIGRTDAEAEAPILTWCKMPTHWKRPWCWERLKAKGDKGGRGRDG